MANSINEGEASDMLENTPWTKASALRNAELHVVGEFRDRGHFFYKWKGIAFPADPNKIWNGEPNDRAFAEHKRRGEI